MEKTLQLKLQRNRKRLQYFLSLKEQVESSVSIDKWIEIYSERIQQLEKQTQGVGLKVELGSVTKADLSRRNAV